MSSSFTGFYQDADFSSLLSNILTQIRISQFIVHMVFEEGSEIAIESSFEHINSEGEVISRFDVYGERKDVTIHELLGKKVSMVEAQSDDRLNILFDSGAVVAIYRSPSRFESCCIYLKGGTYSIT